MYLEGDVFVGNVGPGSSAGSGLLVSGCVELVAAARCATSGTGSCSRAGCSPFGTPAEHAEVSGHDLKAGALLAFLILPLARLNAAFNENERAFLQILLSDFGLFAPDHDFVPLGAFLPLAIAVFVRFIGGDGKIGDGLSTAGVTRFGIAAQAADQNDLVHR